MVEEQIDVAPGAFLAAADRAEQEQLLHAFGAQLVLMRLQQSDHLVPTAHALTPNDHHDCSFEATPFQATVVSLPCVRETGSA